MTAPTLHALFDGSDHGLIADGAASRDVIRKARDVDGHCDIVLATDYAALLDEHEALLRRVDRVESVGKIIVDGAVPATASGHTCFVPKYQIAMMQTALDLVRILAEPGEAGP